MSFFNLTQTGLQDTIKTATDFEGPSTDEVASSARTESKDVNTTQHPVPVPREDDSNHLNKSSEPGATSHVGELYSRTTSRKDQPVHISHVKYTKKHHKHQRNAVGPNDLYKWPITTTQDYGRWMTDKHDTDKWTYQKRHAHVNSEMTRFVDDMGATNKEFTLF